MFERDTQRWRKGGRKTRGKSEEKGQELQEGVVVRAAKVGLDGYSIQRL